MTNPDEEEYSGFKTLGTDIDEAYSMMGDDFDVDEVEFDKMDDD
jgi:hypothetical protein